MDSQNAHRPMLPHWAAHKDKIMRLYISEDRPLKELMGIMRSQDRLHATKFQWETQLKKWGLKKYAAGHDWQEIGRYLRFHNLSLSQVDVLLWDRPLNERRVKKELRRYRAIVDRSHGSQAVTQELSQSPSLPRGFRVLIKTCNKGMLAVDTEPTPLLLFTKLTNFESKLREWPPHFCSPKLTKRRKVRISMEAQSADGLCRLFQPQQVEARYFQPGTAESQLRCIDEVPDTVLATHMDKIIPKVRAILPVSLLLYGNLNVDTRIVLNHRDVPPDASVTRHLNLVYIHLLIYALSNNMMNDLGIGYREIWQFLKQFINRKDSFSLTQLLGASKGKVLAPQLLRAAICADDGPGVRYLVQGRDFGISVNEVVFHCSVGIMNALELAASELSFEAFAALQSLDANINKAGPTARQILGSEFGGPLYWTAIDRYSSTEWHRMFNHILDAGAIIPGFFLQCFFSRQNRELVLNMGEHWEGGLCHFLIDTRDHYITWIQEGIIHKIFQTDGTRNGAELRLLIKEIITVCEENGMDADLQRPPGTKKLLDIAIATNNLALYQYLEFHGYTSEGNQLIAFQNLFACDSATARSTHGKVNTPSIKTSPAIEFLDETYRARATWRREIGTNKATSCLWVEIHAAIEVGHEQSALAVVESHYDRLVKPNYMGHCPEDEGHSCPGTSETRLADLLTASITNQQERLTRLMLDRHMYEIRGVMRILQVALLLEDTHTTEFIKFGGIFLFDNAGEIYNYMIDRKLGLDKKFLEAVVAAGGHFQAGGGFDQLCEAPYEVLQLIMDNRTDWPSFYSDGGLPSNCSMSNHLLQLLSQPVPRTTPRQNSLRFAAILLEAVRGMNKPLVEAICQRSIDVHTFNPLGAQSFDLQSLVAKSFPKYGMNKGTLLGLLFLLDSTQDCSYASLVLRRCCQPGELDRMAINETRLDRLISTYTPLLLAIDMHKLCLVQILVEEFKTDVNFAPKFGVSRTPLQLACERGDLPTVEFLLERGADVNGPIAVDGGATALQLAAIGGSCGIMELLIQRGADLDAPGARFNGRRALEGAAEHGRLDAVNLLLCSGAKTTGEYQASFDKAVKYARDRGHIPLADFMEEFQAKRLENQA